MARAPSCQRIKRNTANLLRNAIQQFLKLSTFLDTFSILGTVYNDVSPPFLALPTHATASAPGHERIPPTRPSYSGGCPTPANFEFLMSLPVPPACSRLSRAISPAPSTDFDSELGDEDGLESGDTNDFAHLLHAHVANGMAVGSPGTSGRVLRSSRASASSDSFAHNMPHMWMRHGPLPFPFPFANHHFHGPGAREGVFQPFGVWNSDGGFSGDGSGGGYGGREERGGHNARAGAPHRWLGW